MKLYLTEKLLWDIFELIKVKDEIIDIIWSKQYHGLKHPLALLQPDFFEYRDAYWEKYKDKKKRERWAATIRSLKNRGYLNIKDLQNRKAIIFTPKGMDRLFDIKIKSIERKQRLDKKWQMVLFDIPEDRRRDRDLFRKQLQYLGYKKLQKSIWVCPFDILKEIEQLIKRYKLDRFVRLLLVEEVKI